jgi:serine phosphatase RsbU (regulator of sigma subunit)
MEAIRVLGKVPIFKGLSKSRLEKVLPLLEEEIFPAETYIIKEGTVGDSMYIITEGSVRVLKSVNFAEEMIINHLYSDTYFGELALIDNLPRSASIVTNEKTIILRLRKKLLDHLLINDPDIARIFYKNCLMDTFSRYRKITTDFTTSKHDLQEKSLTLEEISRDLTSAKKLQDFFINSKTLNHREYPIEGLKQSFIYNPCQEIGGDFLNLVEVGHNKYGIVIADVMGHGITAALATGAFKSAFSIMIKDAAENPTLLLASLNNHFFKYISSLFASCIYCFLDMKKKEITIARAGHYFPVFYKKKKNDLLDINMHGTALGIKKHAHFEQIIYPLETGDKILLFTDGIIEQKNNEGEMYSEERLRKKFLKLAQKDGDSILKWIEKDLDQFSNLDKKDDDITLLLMEFRF